MLNELSQKQEPYDIRRWLVGLLRLTRLNIIGFLFLVSSLSLTLSRVLERIGLVGFAVGRHAQGCACRPQERFRLQQTQLGLSAQALSISTVVLRQLHMDRSMIVSQRQKFMYDYPFSVAGLTV